MILIPFCVYLLIDVYEYIYMFTFDELKKNHEE